MGYVLSNLDQFLTRIKCTCFLTNIINLYVTRLAVNKVSFEFKNINYNLQKAVIGGIVAAAITLSEECKTGYVKVDDVCEETCALNPCQEMIQNLLRADPIKMRLDPVSQDR